MGAEETFEVPDLMAQLVAADKPCLDVFVSIPERSGFVMEQIIGMGSFSVIYKGSNAETGEEVAIKVESAKSKTPQLLYEAKVLKALALGSNSYTPKVHWHGVVENLNIMVMDLLGPSLQDVFTSCNHSLSHEKTMTIGLQIIKSVEYLHSMGFIHRDIKPENLVFGRGSLEELHLIDFGFAKRYTEKGRHHIPMKRTSAAFLGNGPFASLRSHAGLQQSRRDDLESVAYILLYVSVGFIPWAGLKPAEMKEIKESNLVNRFCSQQILRFLRYVRDLGFEDEPNYHRIRKVLRRTSAQKASNEFRISPCALSEYNFVPDWTFHPALHIAVK